MSIGSRNSVGWSAVKRIGLSENCLKKSDSDAMQRREFITLVGGATVAWPLAARAQQTAMPVVGLINSTSPNQDGNFVRAFRQGLSEVGYVEGRNVVIEYRWAAGQNERMPALTADLVRLPVNVIAATTTPAIAAAKAATTTIPTVFITGSDPVAAGLVASLNRPGGNLTGVTFLGVEVAPKQLELARELVPAASKIGFLVNPTNRSQTEALIGAAQAAARPLGLELHILNASNEQDFDAVFATLTQLRAEALVIGPDSFFTNRSAQLAALTTRHNVPAIYHFRGFAEAGGLVSYGGSVVEAFRLVGIYSGRILKGEKPADLPVMQATKVEMIINLKTAKALGLTVPLPLLGRADEVIE
jgi:putative tryptophan/tyrosine transport system substrate-binding protein